MTSANQAREQKQWLQAEQLGAEAVRKAEAASPQSKSLSQALSALGLTYWQEHKYSQAEPIYTRAAALGELAGLDGSSLADDYYAAGWLQNIQNKRAEAEVSLRKALLLKAKVSGGDSLDLCPILRELAFALNELQRRDEAVATLQRCLSIQKVLVGSKKIELANTAAYLGDFYSQAAQFNEAEEYYRQAISIHEAINGSNDFGLAPVLMQLGDDIRRGGKRDKEAEDVLRRALAIEDKNPQQDLSRKAWIENDLALVLSNEGKLDEAETLFLDALDRAEKVNGENAASSRILANLALLYLRQSRLPEAEKIALRAVSLREGALKSDSPGIVSELDILARIYMAERRFDDATKIYRRVYDIQKNSFGADHSETAAAARSVTYSLLDGNKYSEAEDLARASLTGIEKRYGPEHYQTALSLECLATCLRREGQLIKAEPLYLHAMTIRERQPGVKSQELSSAWMQLASFLGEKGHYREAEVMTQKAVAAAPDDRLRGSYLANFAELYRLEGNFSAAEETLLKALDLPDSETVPVHRLRRLGAIACARERYQEGIPELEQSLKLAQKLNNPLLEATILHDLANANRDSYKYDASLQLYRQALAIYEAEKVETPSLASVHDDLGLLALKQRQFSEAEQQFQTAKKIFEASVGTDSARTAICLAHIATLYREQNRLFDAESLFRQSLDVQRAQFGENALIVDRTIEEYAKLLRIEHREEEAKQLQTRVLMRQPNTASASNPSLLANSELQNASNRSVLALSGKIQIKAPMGNFSIWVDKSKWKQNPPDKPGELTFASVDGIDHAKLISEKFGISTATLKSVVIGNMQRVDPNARIVSEEYRNVNGTDVMVLQLNATSNEIPFTFLGYFFGGNSGTVQLVAWTYRDLFRDNLAALTDFLNGLEIDDHPVNAPVKDVRKVVSLLDGKASLAYDSTKWKETQSDQPGRFSFAATSGDGYALVIPEKIQIPLERLPEIALLNLRKADPNAKILAKEKRAINGTAVWYIKTEVSVKEVPLTYLLYLYSGPEGTIQIMTFTGRNLIGAEEPELLSFLGGFRVGQNDHL